MKNPKVVFQAKVRLSTGICQGVAFGWGKRRVNVMADFVDPPTLLGDCFQVEARIIIWKGKEVLRIPASASAVLVSQDGRARGREVG